METSYEIDMNMNNCKIKNFSNFEGLTKITVGKIEPTNPSVGDLWIDTN